MARQRSPELDVQLAQHRRWVESLGKEGNALSLAFEQHDSTDFSGVNLSGALLQEASFEGSLLDGARLDGAAADGIRLKQASLLGTDFVKVQAAEGDFSHSTADRAQFSRAALTNAKFDHASLRDARFAGADCFGASFSDADLRGTDFSRTRLQDADLSRARLAGAVLSGAFLSRRTQLERADGVGDVVATWGVVGERVYWGKGFAGALEALQRNADPDAGLAATIEYRAGVENAPYPIGETRLNIAQDGAGTFEHRRHGQREVWIGRIIPEARIRFFDALSRSRFPLQEMWPPPPPGETMRHLGVGGVKAEAIWVPWHAAMNAPGYSDAFRILDEILGQLSGGAVRIVKDSPTVHVVDARRVT